ncbi:MAG: carboxylating nicotinate-nucleotide diphosphorylase [Candidatus Omnitrophica bacterium]|nr:carboxylating nicotinate-nucleotide diphosphorylase [Candidatus Omnitrophota bacterium]
MDCVKSLRGKTPGGLPQNEIRKIIKNALREDIGKGDLTTRLTIPPGRRTQAKLTAKDNFLLCGILLAKEVFKTVDPGLKFHIAAKEGGFVRKNDTLALVSGKASSILTAERTALNLVALLSGIATKTSRFAEKIKPFKSRITDTRKTIPGIRLLEKYAVRTGGGHNHRMKLDEMILIKDNHLKIMGGYSRLPKAPAGCKVEIEVESPEEFRRALSFNPDIIMLDNMNIRQIKEAIRIRDCRSGKNNSRPVWLEASGGINLANVRKYASTGVEMISIGELTDSVESADISLEFI